jgi:hypothetical protein
MCSRVCSTATCWKWSIFTGSTRLKTPPTPAFAWASVICPSESSWSCSSFSVVVIFASRALTRFSTLWLAAWRVGCSALSSLARVPARTPPAATRLIATSSAANASLRAFRPMTFSSTVGLLGRAVPPHAHLRSNVAGSTAGERG